jgi:[protein-PII] uridylyltransferase
MINNELLFLKQSLQKFKLQLCDAFYQNENITSLTHRLVAHIDEILISLFQKHDLETSGHFCLLALGSYGRRELQLHSDIDLLLLHDDHLPAAALQRAQSFIQDCWDLNLKPSHQVSCVNDCARLASSDLSVISSLLDMHLICGRASLMEALNYQIHPLHMWSSHDFFYAKREEQQKLYEKYAETAYNLEPNVKYGPGGLRDLQLILSIGKRHFGIKKLAEGIAAGLMTEKEFEELNHCQHFLWRVRFALHLLTGKNEERLLFDHQAKLAQIFAFHDEPASLGLEQFMKTYFKTIKRSRELNDMLLQCFAEAIIHQAKQQLTPLDKDFQLSNHTIEVRHEHVFSQHPEALITLFLWLARDPSILGVRANTVRLIRQHLYLIDAEFRQSREATQSFIEIIKIAENPYTILHYMSQYGVLSHYLDAFAAVTGQMQFDLFHVYTVDQHTLFVIRNLARFLDSAYATEFPLAAKIMPGLKQREILYLAALFHDIAKGRGGDHSELGAMEAEHFAKQHQLTDDEEKLFVWLVRYHLLMSKTAHRQDIYDPQTIQHFCQQIPDKTYLDHLYLLTVADICGTNPKLWNAWKDSLLKELYFAAHQALDKTSPLTELALIASRKQQASALLDLSGIASQKLDSLWQSFHPKYFLHEPAEIIAQHSAAILNCQHFPLVMVMPHHTGAGTEVFIYMPHHDARFTLTTTIMSNCRMTIQEANILTLDNHFDLDIYVILDEQDQRLLDEKQARDLQEHLSQQLRHCDQPLSVTQRRRPRTHLHLKPKLRFIASRQENYSCLHLRTADRAGLLAGVSQVFSKLGIQLHHAKIMTTGEQVDDLFYIQTQMGAELSLKEQETLQIYLLDALQAPA